MLTELNKNILIYLNSLWENFFIEKIVIIFADSPIFFIPIFLLIMRIYYSNIKDAKKIDLLYIFYWSLIWIIIALIIQQIIIIDRPETVINWTWKLLLKHLPDASFPSDHATVSFAFITWLFLANYKKTFYFYLPFVILMNLSRIIAWVHWPFDILAWMLVWILWWIISFKILTKYKFVNIVNNYIIKTMWKIKL